MQKANKQTEQRTAAPPLKNKRMPSQNKRVLPIYKVRNRNITTDFVIFVDRKK